MTMSQCIFCRIAAHHSPARIEYEDEEVVIFHDIHPQAPIHLLIIPRKHINRLQNIQEEDTRLVGNLILAASRQAERMGLSEKGYRLVVNNGPWAGQAIFHMHFHLLGGRPLRWPPG